MKGCFIKLQALVYDIFRAGRRGLECGILQPKLSYINIILFPCQFWCGTAAALSQSEENNNNGNEQCRTDEIFSPT